MIPSRAALGRMVAAGALMALAACLSDAMAPNAIGVEVVGSAADAWTVAPGADTVVRIRVLDASGAPVVGATLRWIPIGTGAGVTEASAATDFVGAASARWRPGTRASETPLLRVSARYGGVSQEIDIRGRLLPSVVASLRSVAELPLVARLGDTITPAVVVTDPYGNTVDTPVTLKSHDTVLVANRDAAVVAVRRGRTMLTAEAQGQQLEIPVQVVQYVQAIEPRADTLWFTSLGAEQPVEYVVRDDRGFEVLDTLVALRVADTTLAMVAGAHVRAVAPGLTIVELAIGPVTASVPVGVRQRVASLTLLDTLRVDALLDTLLPQPLALDSLGYTVLHPDLSFLVTDTAIARTLPGAGVVSLRPGTTTLRVRDAVSGVEATALLMVWQRPARIVGSADTVRFDAVGDSLRLTGVVYDALGSVIPDAPIAVISHDTSVVSVGEPLALRARGNGAAIATLAAGDAAAPIAVIVEQVVTSLSVAPAEAVVSRPAGAVMPLVCEARDRNGYLAPNDPVLVASAKGTVSGTGCANARVATSGYDTLTFAVAGLEVRVPVIVATRPDSVGIVAAAPPLTDVVWARFVGEDLSSPSLLALRPLVRDILAAYGNPSTNLDRARAIRDWVSRTAVHPSEFLHPGGSQANKSVLPPGKTWAEVNAIANARTEEDLLYWTHLSGSGFTMLDRLLGTLDLATGLRADDGMMVLVGGGHYRIRDVETYRYLLCSFQSVIVTTLWSAAGLHGLILQTLGHDPAAVFIPELGRWVYEDPTLNEEFLLDGEGDPLSPATLVSLGLAGMSSRARPTKGGGPSYDPQVYVPDQSYMNVFPEGFVIMGSRLYRKEVENPTVWDGYFGQLDSPALAGTPFDSPIRLMEEQVFPVLGVTIDTVILRDSVFVAHLSSTFPNHATFERRVAGGVWQAASPLDVLPVGACEIEYRSRDAMGNASAVARLDAWVPRAAGFIETGSIGGSRWQAQYCP